MNTPSLPRERSLSHGPPRGPGHPRSPNPTRAPELIRRESPTSPFGGATPPRGEASPAGNPTTNTKAPLTLSGKRRDPPATDYQPPSPPPRPVPTEAPVGGCWQRSWENWSLLGASDHQTQAVKEGVRLFFHTKPPLTTKPVFFPPPQDPVRRGALEEAVRDLWEQDAIEPVTDWDSPGFYNHIFVTPKKDPDKWRPITNLTHLNEFLVNFPFKMETAITIQTAIQPGQWATSVDLKSAYLQVPVHPSSRKFLRFTHLGKVYQHKTLVFGLASSPRLFTEFVLVLARHLREQGILFHAYLDDWLVRGPDPETVSQHTGVVLRACQDLGMRVNWEKSMLTPKQDFEFVGVYYQLAEGLARPPVERIVKMEGLLHRLLDQGFLPAELWQSLIGIMSSMMRQIPMGRLYLRPLQWHLADSWESSTDPPTASVPLTQDLVPLLHWWLQRDNTSRGVPLLPFQASRKLYTDASDTGWGAHLENPHREVQGTWSPDILLHRDINWKELKTVVLALQAFHSDVHNQTILLATDNTTVVAYINNQGGTRSRSLMVLVWELFQWCLAHNCQLRARHIPGRLNVLADQLSRDHQVISTEWSLSPSVTERIWLKWGKPWIDLFATRLNTKLPHFVSPVPDEKAWQVDALSIDWTRMWAYAFPPSPLLPALLQKMLKEPCTILLIAPYKPERPWFPLLLQLLTDQPWPLPNREDLLYQPRTGTLHRNPESLALHAWRLSSEPTETKVSLLQ